MKKIILALALTLGTVSGVSSWASSAPKHRYHSTPVATEVADDKNSDKNDAKSAIEAYSDTTSLDSATDEDDTYASDADDDNGTNNLYSPKNYDSPFDYFGTIFGKAGLVLVVLFFVVIGLAFLFAPFIIIYLIIRYLNRRHQDRVKLAEMAMEKGINVPEETRPIDKQSDEYLQKRGLRNAFLGAGLWAMFSIWNAEFLAGLGALVMFYGLGQIVIGLLPAIKQRLGGKRDNDTTGYTGESI